MASNPLLTLSSKGLLTGVGERIDKLLAYFISSDLSQSDLYLGQIKSLQGYIAESDGNDTQLQGLIEKGLTELFGAQFDAVSCKVTITAPATDGSNRYHVQIDLRIVEQGQNYNSSATAPVVNGIVQQLLNANNGTA